ATRRPYARRCLRVRQPRLLLAAPRQELLLLAHAPLVPRLPRRRRRGARQRRPRRRRVGARRASGRVPARRTRAWLAARPARRLGRAARPLPPPRPAGDLDRR